MKSFLEWLGVIASIATLVSLALYIIERYKRHNQSSLTLGFLHGIKSTIQGMVDSTVRSSLLEQINDMMARLNPPKPKKGK